MKKKPTKKNKAPGQPAAPRPGMKNASSQDGSLPPGAAGTLSQFGGGFLLLCLLASLVFAYLVMKPFLTIILLAAVLVIISRPVYVRILGRTKNRETLAALLTVIGVVLVVILPFLVLLSLLASEAAQAYEWINDVAKSGMLEKNVFDRFTSLQQKYLPQLDLDLSEMSKSFAGMAGKVSNILFKLATAALGVLGSAVWQFVLMLIALFYLLKDGPRFLRWVMHLVPLADSLEDEIIECFKEVSRSAFYGTFLTAVAQGALGGIGFWIAGLPPLVWGVVMAFFSMVPMVGTALVWAPAAIALVVTGHTGSGIFLALWGVLVVGMSDNFLRPFLMQGKNQLHPLLIFFSLIGGLSAFGLLGILLGPLAIVICTALLKAYEEAARPILMELDNR